ncbi:hypothetical protein ACIQNG_04855 [Streptomyces sp. NPDC091377]|uniref:hypothetical protein n=1 Tax=Streptomyces sp. NPDC091377 TaxID=3365995 RepID=UPI00381BBC4F
MTPQATTPQATTPEATPRQATTPEAGPRQAAPPEAGPLPAGAPQGELPPGQPQQPPDPEPKPQPAPAPEPGEAHHHPEPEPDVDELFDALGPTPRSLLYAPNANFNTGTVHGGQRVWNAMPGEDRPESEGRVREGPIPVAEVRAAAFGFAEPAWFGAALGELAGGLLFLSGRPGSGRRTAALNLLRESCGEGATLRALDSVTELDRWKPTDTTARGYLMDGLFPSGPMGPGVLGHVRSLLKDAGARMVIVLPDDAALLHSLRQQLHVEPVVCQPPPPALVFGSRFEAKVTDRWERERLLAALGEDELGGLLVPELVPAEVAELVDTLVAADGDPERLGDLGARLSHRAEQEVPALVASLRDDPDALAFLLSACVYERLDHRIVREEADRLLELSDGRLAALLPATDAPGGAGTDRPNPAFVFRRSLTELLESVHACRQPREIRAGGAYAHSVEPVVFVRHRQAEVVLRHVWREYGQLSDLVVAWLRDVRRGSELSEPAGRAMGRAASWGGGRRALDHVETLAESDRYTSRMIAAHALGIAAEDPVLVAEVRHRLQRWSLAANPYLRTTVAYACGAVFGLSRPDFALRLLRTLVGGTRLRGGGYGGDDENGAWARVGRAVRAAVLRLFVNGNEPQVFARLLAWLNEETGDTEELLTLFGELLRRPGWFQRHLAHENPAAPLITDVVRRALDTDGSFDATCRELLRWAEAARWDETVFRSVENLFASLAGTMSFGVFRLFVEMDQKSTDDWAGHAIARRSLDYWRNGEQREAV